MTVELTPLIISQIKTFAVMAVAGIVTETLWQAKGFVQRCTVTLASDGIWKKAALIAEEAVFWIGAAWTLSSFLYYCAFGRITLHGTVSFLIGLLLWKKICSYVILGAWEGKEEAQNLKTTAKSLIWTRQDRDGNSGDRQKKKKNRNASVMKPARKQGEKWRSEGAGQDGDF